MEILKFNWGLYGAYLRSWDGNMAWKGDETGVETFSLNRWKTISKYWLCQMVPIFLRTISLSGVWKYSKVQNSDQVTLWRTKSKETREHKIFSELSCSKRRPKTVSQSRLSGANRDTRRLDKSMFPQEFVAFRLVKARNDPGRHVHMVWFFI